MSIPEYSDLLKRFLLVAKESGYTEVEPNEHHDNELEGDEFMIVWLPGIGRNSPGEWDVRFRGGVLTFHSATGQLVSVT